MRFQRQMLIPAAREQVWELLADTDRLNREMGLPPIHFEFRPQEGGGSEILATLRLGRLALKYREHPFEWVRPEQYSVRRTFFGGPIQEIRGRVRLDAEDGSTRITCVAQVAASGVAGYPIAYAVGARSVADFMRACRTFASYLAGKVGTPYPRHSGKPPAIRARLERTRATLAAVAGADPDIARRLAQYLERAPAEDVVQIRPFALADRWGLDRMAVLRTCLLATRVGMLDLRWRVLCPACRGAPATAAHLSNVGREVHCPACNIRFDAEFDRSVEVCFAVPPALRPVQETTHCVGGPALTPHILAQWLLAPHESRETRLPLPPGSYGLTGPSLAEPLPFPFDARDGARAEVVLEPTASGRPGVRVGEPRGGADQARLNGDCVFRLENRTGETVLLRLESPEWSSAVATAAMVTSLQAFRDQFSSEVLAPGAELSIRQICFLFSDLKGSTAMYRRLGDAPSYRAVRDHFEFLRHHIAAHTGAVVKTIGDAIMATFLDPADGLAAALAIQREAPRSLEGLTVKLGLHWGPAIAVNANDTLDYFGHTVNLAARLQEQSLGGDIVLSAALATDDRVQRLLADGVARIERFEATVRGLSEPVSMLRVWPAQRRESAGAE